MARIQNWSLHRKGRHIHIWGEREEDGVATLTSPVVSLSDAGVAETLTGSVYHLSEVGNDGKTVVEAKNALGNESFL